MPDEPVVPTHVLTVDAVKWAIDLLGHRKIHPAFIYYLYLRARAADGNLSEASASAPEVVSLVQMPGGPPGKPYYRPLRERGDRTGVLLRTFWMQRNLAGSWSPASLNRIAAAHWLVNGTQDGYVLPADHAAMTRERLLFDQPVSALAMGAFFLRNDGFLLDDGGGSSDVVEGFRRKFRFGTDGESEFSALFDLASPNVSFNWFEPIAPLVATQPLPASAQPEEVR